ncbi:MAG: glycosyltransferase family 4 protein [Candidatus Aenigmarchaeota archaeon]|nr:glycosyltransferase family 4 protein [Candidatus Aenigmarchaeota archaeon]
MPRVLFVLDFFPPHVGGAETLFDNLTKSLAALGVEVAVLTQKLPGTRSFEISENRRIYRVYSPIRHSFSIAAAKKCIELSRNVDIVHASTLGGLATVMLVGRFIKKPVVATVFEVWDRLFLRLQKPPVSIINYAIENLSLAYYKNSFCVAISKATRNAMIERGFDGKKVSVIYPGIRKGLFNTKTAPATNVRGRKILFFGRPGVAKGVGYLIHSMPIVKKSVPDAKLILLLSKRPVGEYKKIVGLIKKLRLEKDVILLDPRPVGELPGIIRSAEVCVVPSVSEGFGFSAAESLSCGTPVVASAVGSLPEIVKHGYNGFLSAPESPGSIAENVIKVLSDRKLRRRLAANAPGSVKVFDWMESAKKYVKIYKSVLKWQKKWK